MNTGGLKGAISSASRPFGGLLAVGIGISGFAAPAMHGLGVPFSTALIVAGLGIYHVTVNGTSTATPVSTA